MIGEGEEPSGKKTSRCKCVCLTILIIVAINFGIFYRQEIYDQFSKLSKLKVKRNNVFPGNCRKYHQSKPFFSRQNSITRKEEKKKMRKVKLPSKV